MHLRRLLSLLALAFLVSPCLAAAQSTGTIRGRVTDSRSGAPLASVQINVDGARIGGQTGSDGNYTLTGVPTGPQTLVVRRVGYALQRIPVNVSSGATAVHNVALAAVATTLNDVVVTALGQQTEIRSLGTAQEAVRGAVSAETQREFFINSLQGCIAGV